eukprot:NODE_21933_length_730_cov_2.298507.p1 GENE.NODE_21933_length_730_cov_2.298507~~NODE_21933_length_730_cov_2.298507.p1  ORF type:complete len:194 (-),score=55.82 NODE_21933_length_730_cov_2.298507:62-643(-)
MAAATAAPGFSLASIPRARSTPSAGTVAVLAGGVAAVALAALALQTRQRRRRRLLRRWDDDGDGTPTSLARPPTAGPAMALPARDELLDDALFALGMTCGPVAGREAALRHVAAPPREPQHPSEAEDVVYIQRVSAEEEERRYFANMAGGAGDIFGGGDDDTDRDGRGGAAAAGPCGCGSSSERARPVIGYEG